MTLPLEIRFHNVDRSSGVENEIRERAAKLEQFADHLLSCVVTVERAHKHHRQGNLFAVRIDLRLAGGRVLATRYPSARQSHEDVRVAIRDAFRAVRRRLRDRVRKLHGDVKHHTMPLHGKIIALEHERDCGRIATSDGREVYFHRNSVLDASFDRLETGAEVRFSEEAGDQGPQASTVHLVGKHHLVE
jgi:cold shock CspA family protein/ribosome-associated translation inhibitor RaiA